MYVLFHLDYSKSSNFQIFSGISLKIDLVIFAFVKKYPSDHGYCTVQIYVSDLPELKFLAIWKKSEIFSVAFTAVQFSSVKKINFISKKNGETKRLYPRWY